MEHDSGQRSAEATDTAECEATAIIGHRLLALLEYTNSIETGRDLLHDLLRKAGVSRAKNLSAGLSTKDLQWNVRTCNE